MFPQKLNIWLADDDEDDRFLFQSALLKIGVEHKLVSFVDGQAFLNHLLATEESPDFVFLDINMPLVDGLTCLEKIKQQRPGHTFPVIMLSTAWTDSMISSCHEKGASLYLKKPNRFPELIDMLNYCLHESVPAQLQKFGFARM